MLQRKTERWPRPLLSPASAWLQCEKSLDRDSELLSGTVFLSTRLAIRTALCRGGRAASRRGAGTGVAPGCDGVRVADSGAGELHPHISVSGPSACFSAFNNILALSSPLEPLLERVSEICHLVTPF